MRRIQGVSSVLAALVVSTASSAALAQSAVVISEFRTSGTSRLGAKDELIELHNTTCSPIDVSGFSVRYATCGISDPAASEAVAVLPANTVIQPNGFYLLANTAYSEQVPADQPFAATFGDLSDNDGGIAIVDRDGKILDAVGFCDVVKFPGFPFREGSPLTPASPEGSWTFLRHSPYPEGSSYCEPETDTGNNAKDFFFNASPAPQNAQDAECTARPAACETNVGTANAITGTCSFPPKSVGLTCEDGNGCTVQDKCDGKGNCQSGEECPDPKPFCNADGNVQVPQSTCTFPTKDSPGVCVDGNPDGGEPTILICAFGCRDGVCEPDPCSPEDCAIELAPPCYVEGSGTCSQGVCTFTPDFEATACDDGDPCTTNEVCVGDGEGSPISCLGAPTPVDDGDPCTTDACTPSTGVTHLPLPNGTSCNDDTNACNGVSACQDGACVETSKPVDCLTQAHACDLAPEGVCDPATGLCSFPTLPEGAACSDGSGCTTDDKCDALGRCAGVDLVCPAKDSVCADASNQTTFAGICAGGDCGFVETTLPCALGCDSATGQCIDAPCGGACAPSDNPCAINQCDVATNVCVPIPRPATKCDDGNACTVDDACGQDVQGAIGCLGVDVVCNNPPPSACLADGKTSLTFSPSGVCSADGPGCKYAEVAVDCPNGCDAQTGKCVAATGGQGGAAGTGGAGQGGGAGQSGSGGAAQGGAAGNGNGGVGGGGKAGASGASGQAGKGGAAGTAGKGGSAGTAGKGGSGGKAGASGKGGASGAAGKAGAAGQAAAGQGGAAAGAPGTGGSQGPGGSSVQGSGARAGSGGTGFGTSQSADAGASDFEGSGLQCSVGAAGTETPGHARGALAGLLALAFAGIRRRRRISPLRAERKKGTEHAMSSVDSSLLDKVLRSLRAPHTDEPQRSAGELLTASAAAYGARPSDEEHTAPTGFDPMAAVLFESIVESAFLVANADNEFDDRERAVLVAVVEAGSGGSVTGRQVEALLADLAEQLEEDGAEARIAWVARMVRKPEQKADVLRIAAVLAHASAGVSDVERDTLLKLGQAMGIEGAAVDQALADAATALA